MRRKQKTTREYQEQTGGFVPPGIVRRQATRERAAFPQPVPEPASVPEPEITPEPTEPKEKK